MNINIAGSNLGLILNSSAKRNTNENKVERAYVDKYKSSNRTKDLLEISDEAYNEFLMQHEIAVAQQQSETWKKAAEDASKAFQIAAKLSKGEKVTSSEVKMLMEFDPQLYLMAMTSAAMSKRHNRQENIKPDRNDADNLSSKNMNGVDWVQFKWKTYESQMPVSLNGDDKIEGVSKEESA